MTKNSRRIITKSCLVILPGSTLVKLDLHSMIYNTVGIRVYRMSIKSLTLQITCLVRNKWMSNRLRGQLCVLAVFCNIKIKVTWVAYFASIHYALYSKSIFIKIWIVVLRVSVIIIVFNSENPRWIDKFYKCWKLWNLLASISYGAPWSRGGHNSIYIVAEFAPREWRGE